MADSDDLRQIAMALEGTSEAPHFDRRAFKVKRIYATLAADGRSANLNLTPDEQALKCMVTPEIFQAIDNGWGRQGWTVMWLAPATVEDVRAALEMAHAHGVKR